MATGRATGDMWSIEEKWGMEEEEEKWRAYIYILFYGEGQIERVGMLWIIFILCKQGNISICSGRDTVRGISLWPTNGVGPSLAESVLDRILVCRIIT